jgi:hypothetical protein
MLDIFCVNTHTLYISVSYNSHDFYLVLSLFHDLNTIRGESTGLPTVVGIILGFLANKTRQRIMQ